MIFPAKTLSERVPSRTKRMACELEEQKMLNAELLRVCNRQRHLLAEQSEMIEEILEGIGR